MPGKPLPQSIGILNRIRYGLKEPGKSRIVVDLFRPATVESAVYLNAGDAKKTYRLVIDLSERVPVPFRGKNGQRGILDNKTRFY